MTNLERWRLYMREVGSPNSFIDFGYYYIITACLQRRVWFGPDHKQLFPNMYYVLCGKAGLGKGQVIGPVNEFISFFKLTGDVTQKKVSAESAVEVANFFMSVDNKAKKGEEINRIAIAPDALTYERLVQLLGQSISAHPYPDPEVSGKWKTYLHSSLCFTLEELSSLFPKNTDKVANFFLNCYDCKPYNYETKSGTRDRIMKPCLSMLAGTTPAFLQDTFSDKLLNDGFASRTIFIFEYANRFNNMFFTDLDFNQRLAKQELLLHIDAITKLYGRTTISQKMTTFLADWWKQHTHMPRPNASLKLDSYYARKQVHVLKLAMSIHFGESTSMQIADWAIERAMALLEDIEKRMHYALTFGETNPLARASKKVLAYLRQQERWVGNPELLVELWDDVRGEELSEVINFLSGTEQIETKIEKSVAFYKIKEKAPSQTS